MAPIFRWPSGIKEVRTITNRVYVGSNPTWVTIIPNVTQQVVEMVIDNFTQISLHDVRMKLTSIFALAIMQLSHASDFTLSWDQNPETDVDKYIIWGGYESGVYTESYTVTTGVEYDYTVAPTKTVKLNKAVGGNQFTGWSKTGNVTLTNTQAVFNADKTIPNGVLTYALVTVPGRVYTVQFNASAPSSIIEKQKINTTISYGGGVKVDVTEDVDSVGFNTEGQWYHFAYTFTADDVQGILKLTDMSTASDLTDLKIKDVHVTYTEDLHGAAHTLFFVVQAGNNSGRTGPISEEISVVMAAAAPTAPTNFKQSL